MPKCLDQVITSIKNIAIQVEQLNPEDISPELLIFGQDSAFDSLAMLLLLVELEQNLDAETLADRNLVEWFAALDFVEHNTMTVEQFSDLLSNECVQA